MVLIRYTVVKLHPKVWPEMEAIEHYVLVLLMLVLIYESIKQCFPVVLIAFKFPHRENLREFVKGLIRGFNKMTTTQRSSGFD